MHWKTLLVLQVYSLEVAFLIWVFLDKLIGNSCSENLRSQGELQGSKILTYLALSHSASTPDPSVHPTTHPHTVLWCCQQVM